MMGTELEPTMCTVAAYQVEEMLANGKEYVETFPFIVLGLQSLARPGMKGCRLASSLLRSLENRHGLTNKQWDLAYTLITRPNCNKRKTTPGLVPGFFATNLDITQMPKWFQASFKVTNAGFGRVGQKCYTLSVPQMLELISWNRSVVYFKLIVHLEKSDKAKKYSRSTEPITYTRCFTVVRKSRALKTNPLATGDVLILEKGK